MALLIAAALGLWASPRVRGAPRADEMLDPTFGVGGKVTTGLEDSGLAANATAVDASGRVVVAGGYAPAGDPRDGVAWMVARYLSDGRADTGFDGDGLRLDTAYDCGGSLPCDIEGQARAVLPLSDGRVMVAGDDGDAMLVARYLADGRLDTAFGEGGWVRGQVDEGRRSAGRGLAPGPSGSVHVLVADGSRSDPGDERFQILRLDAGGAPDSGFGDFGVHEEAFAPVVARAILRQPNGRLLVAGYHDYGDDPGSSAKCFVARYWANGAGRDDTFGDNGIAELHHDFDGAFDTCAALALGADGSVALTGSSNERLAVARLTAEGQPDEAFSGDGRLVVSVASEDSVSGEGVGVDPSGRVVVGGTHWISGAGSRFVALRVRADGAPDATFGPGGVVESTFGGAVDVVAYALAVQPNGRFLVAGRSEDTETWSKIAIARYTNAAGAPTTVPSPTGPGGTTTVTPTRTPTRTSTVAPTVDPTGEPTVAPTVPPTVPPTVAPTVTRTATATATVAPTPTESGYAVRGRVTLERRPTSGGAQVCVAARCAQTDAAGLFLLSGVQGAGPLVVTHPGYLRAERPVAPPAAGATVDAPPVTLVSGDVNGDGRVEVDDAAMIGQRFLLRHDPAQPDPRWLAAADITDDGVIDILDLVAVQYNLRKVAPSPWP